ncbi:MAG: glycosyltransferase [Planctomycetota bacterium]|jgi:hypothetical protein
MTDCTHTQQNRRALVVAYVFPPAGGAGVQRVTKFVKYLPDFGWNCSVLTVANPSVPVFDESLQSDIPADTVIRRARTLEPGYALKNTVSAVSDSQASGRPSLSGRIKRRLKQIVRAAGNTVLQPDAQILWYPAAIREGLRLLREQTHDAIFVTAPPFSAFVIGAELSRRSGLPLVIDYRDEWGISNRYQENRQKSGLSQWLQNRMQQRVLRQARAAIATTRLSAAAIQQAARAAGSAARVTPIYNGYDAADIGDACPFSQSRPSRDKLRLAYVGTLWNLTSIEPVVAALLRLNETMPEIAERIELLVAGRRTSEQEMVLDQLDNTSCQLIREGYVDHSRAIEIMRSADVQCLLLSDVREAGRVVPAKTFEYLALQHPILSVTPVGEVTDILAGCPFATSMTPDNVTGIADYLRQCVEAHCMAGVPIENVSDLTEDYWSAEKFERRHLTGELAAVLNDVCGVHSIAPRQTERGNTSTEAKEALATGTGGLA